MGEDYWVETWRLGPIQGTSIEALCVWIETVLQADFARETRPETK